MIGESVQLLVVGLAVVYLFLGLLVLILYLLPLIGGRPTPDGTGERAVNDAQRARIAAAIAVALSRRRSRR